MTRQQFMLGAALAATGSSVQAQGKRVFELRTYYCLPGRLPNLLARFRDHTCKLFEKHGITNVGYWVPQDAAAKEGAPGKDNTLVYLLAHASRDAAKKSWDAFRADPDWTKARTASEADGKIVDRVESVYLDATDFSAMK